MQNFFENVEEVHHTPQFTNMHDFPGRIGPITALNVGGRKPGKAAQIGSSSCLRR